ncbi:GNAT family N-acetyltransferase [Varibaculum cambriense]|uniref:GNAT family N-acetyltransferase n=1 Tax=Varibaculum cambriense TaxID=184870 RepID=UPI00291455D4|nr:GNAT family N-acetyltransferase [Varibaculum cambriense]MDU3273692.1 GNAT family N-acetyltransferase [Varibaculum cambriense]
MSTPMQIRQAETAGDMLDIFATRREVFHLEQGISLDREIDDIDFAKGTIHLLGEDASGTIAAARISPPKIGIPADLAEMFPQLPRDTITGKLGRFAVLPAARGYGNGKELVRGAERLALSCWARSEGDGVVLLQVAAQVPVIGFYRKLGYRLVTSRDPYLDAGIEHRDLVKLVEPQASVVQFPGRWL